MFLRQTVQDISKKNEDNIRELEISLNKLEMDIMADFREIGVSPEQMEAFFDARENFSDEEWEEVLRVKLEVNDRLHCQKNSLPSAHSVQKAREGLPKDGRWIHVR